MKREGGWDSGFVCACALASCRFHSFSTGSVEGSALRSLLQDSKFAGGGGGGGGGLHGRRGTARLLLSVTSLRVSGLTSHLLQQIGFELFGGWGGVGGHSEQKTTATCRAAVRVLDGPWAPHNWWNARSTLRDVLLAVSGCDDWGGLLKLGPWAVFEPSTETPHPCKGHQSVVLVARLSTGQAQNTHTHTHKQICTCTRTLAFSTIPEFQGRWLYYCCCNTALIQGRSDPSLFFSAPASLDQVLILPLPHEWQTQEGLHLLLPHASNVTQVHMLSCSFW